MNLGYDSDRGVYYNTFLDARDLDFYWTFWCGDGGEEIDVCARSESMAREVCKAAIERDYEAMEITHVERRSRGVMYF